MKSATIQKPDGTNRRCTARSRNGKQCQKPPRPGMNVCTTHGGKAPQTVAAAARRLQSAAIDQAITTYGLPRHIPPDQALLEEHARTVGAVDWLETIVRAQDPAALTWGLDEEAEKGSGEFPGTDRTRRARASVWLQIYQAERKHLHDISQTIIQLGLDARRVQLAEAQGRLVAGAVRAILADLGLTPEQEALVGEVVPRHLRAIAQVEGEVAER